METFLDQKNIDDFRNSINETEIFRRDERYKDISNLFPVVMDRMDSCVSYLNNHATPPETEEELLVFIMYSCMIIDALHQLFRSKPLDLKRPFKDNEDESYKYFKETCMSAPLNLSNNDCPTDDKFFEYFRSLTMAHPFETSRPKFFEKNEVQYSPWVIKYQKYYPFKEVKNAIGVRIYSNKFDEIKDLIFSFDILKDYIKSRYDLIDIINIKINEITSTTKNEWKKNIIPNDLSPLATLEKIISIFSQRYLEHYNHYIETAILYLGYPITNPNNYSYVDEYRDALEQIIPNLVKGANELNYDDSINELSAVLSPYTKNYNSGNYELEKIFVYLKEDKVGTDDYDFALQMAKSFDTNFACKWVEIDFDSMNIDEIKLLIRVSCFKDNLENK